MKRVIFLMTALGMSAVLGACGREAQIPKNASDGSERTQQSVQTEIEWMTHAVEEKTDRPTQSMKEAESEQMPQSGETDPGQTADEEKEEMNETIQVLVGEQTFTARLYDNETTRAFLEKLPMTLDMSELNGNEKYYYLDDSLPTQLLRPSEIHAGDIMLYGSDCVVLFYESFSTSYSYTPMGCLESAEGLAEALGRGSVQVTFQKE